MDTPRILIIEDAPEVGNLLERCFGEEGFQTMTASDGTSALRLVDDAWDAIILDLMLPDIPGETILDHISQRLDHPPVLVLSSRDQLNDKLSLFKHGCDDYMVKPFAFEELLSRVRALMRRSPKALPDILEYEDMRLDVPTHVLHVGQTPISLTPKEFSICRLLLRHYGKVVSRAELVHVVWGLTHEPRTNFIEVHLANLRKKLAHAGRENWLQTVRSSGFIFCRPAEGI